MEMRRYVSQLMGWSGATDEIPVFNEHYTQRLTSREVVYEDLGI